MAWRAWQGKGLPGEPVREMLIEAVEKRFGAVEAVSPEHALEFLTDSGGACIADDTRRIARSLGLRPIDMPVCSPQGNGMAESFVNTFRRDYLSRLDLSDAPTVPGTAAGSVRALQRGASALELEDGNHPGVSGSFELPTECAVGRYIANRPYPESRGQQHKAPVPCPLAISRRQS